MKKVKGKLKVDVIGMQKHRQMSLEEVIEKGCSCTAETVYRNVKAGEELVVTVYDTQNYFLTTPYFDVETTDGYGCALDSACIEFDNPEDIAHLNSTANPETKD